MNKLKGFTIIELVVVIAIIAILATIVLIGINGYIKKSQDASLKETMHTVQTDVISNATTGTGLAFTSANPCSGVEAWTTGVQKLQPTAANAVCASNYTMGMPPTNGTKFCACVQELSDTTKYVCIDTNKLVETSTCLTACTATGSLTCP